MWGRPDLENFDLVDGGEHILNLFQVHQTQTVPSSRHPLPVPIEEPVFFDRVDRVEDCHTRMGEIDPAFSSAHALIVTIALVQQRLSCVFNRNATSFVNAPHLRL